VTIGDTSAEQCFEVVRVDALPYAHQPYQCRHAGRFDAAAGGPEHLHWTEHAVAQGRLFYESLTPADFKSCHYHRADWHKIALASIHVLAIGPDGAGDFLAACRAVIKHRRLRRRDQGWLISLFTEPIDWHPGLVTVTNGQHRICALRAAGAAECVVRTS
jgi:hypothetical protein